MEASGLIEAAKLAPHWNEQLALLHEKELARGNRNRATLVIARKVSLRQVIYLWRPHFTSSPGFMD
jgi:hypothetical protein